MGEGVDHRVLHRGRRADRAGLADPLDPQRVERGRCLHGDQLEAGQLGRGDRGVVGQVARYGVSVGVEDHLFQQRLRGTLGDAAVPLALGQHGVEHRPGVVHRDVPDVPDLAGLGVHLHHGHVRAEWERGPVALELDVGHQPVPAGLPRDLGPAQCGLRVAAHLPAAGAGVQIQVVLGGLEHPGRDAASLVLDLARGLVHGRPAELQRPRGERADADRDQVGVAVDHRHLVHRDAQFVLHEHGPRGVVALAVRGTAGVDGRGAVVVDGEAGGLPRLRVNGGDLDVGREPDADLDRVIAFPPLGLLRAQAVITGRLQHRGERVGVPAGVVFGAAGRRERELVRRHDVQPAHLGRVHPDFGGEQVDGALDGRRGLRPAGAAIGGDRRGVGDGHPEGGLHPGDVVDAGRHQAREGGQEPAHPRVGATVLHDVDPVGEDPAVPVPADRQRVHLVPAVRHRHHVLAAGLHPADRPAGLPCGPGDRHGLPVYADLGAEAAAHVGRDHPDGARVELQRAGQDDPGELGVLGARPHRQLPVPPDRRGGAHLQRHGRDALVDDRPLDHYLTPGEQGVIERGAAVLAGATRGGDVRSGRGEEQGVPGQRRRRAHHRGQRVVVHADQLGYVLAPVAPGGPAGQDQRHGLAHEPDPAAREHRLGERAAQRSRAGLAALFGCDELGFVGLGVFRGLVFWRLVFWRRG